MPSHADRVRRHYEDADPQEKPALASEAWKQPFSDLERYGGWLGKDHVSVAVRADIHALGAAIGVGTETSTLLMSLDKDIGRLPGGDLRKMLQKTVVEIRALLEPRGIEARDGGDS